MPGDNVKLEVELGKPIAMNEGLRFAIREGGPHGRFGRRHQDPRLVAEFPKPRRSSPGFGFAGSPAAAESESQRELE